MSRRAELADGTILEFPDNTTDAVMDRVVREHIGKPRKTGTLSASGSGKAKVGASKPGGAARPTSFMQGVRERAQHGFLNAMSLNESIGPITLPHTLARKATDFVLGTRTPTLQQTMMGDRAGIGPATFGRAAQNVMQDISDRAPTRGSAAGNFFGGALGAAPSFAVPGAGLAGMALQGTVGGALMAENPEDAADVASNAGLGAALGFGLGLAGKGLKWVVSGPGRKVLSPTMQAADDLDIQMLPADVGGTPTRIASAVTRSTTLGEIPIAEASGKSIASAAAANQRVAGTIGSATDRTGAGQAAKRGAQAFIDASEKRATELYERIPIPAQTNATTTNTREALTNLTRGFESNPELSAIWASHPRLEATLRAITGTTDNVPTGILDQSGAPLTREVARGGKLSWADMKQLRSTVGQIIGRPSLSDEGPAIEAMRGLYAGLTRDMEATAMAQGPKALTAFNRATQYYRGRQGRIDRVLTGLLGKDYAKGEGAAFDQINRWAQAKGGDFKKLAQSMRSMPPDEAATIRATIIDKMGLAQPGRQDATGVVFSPAEWATQWNKLDPRAKSVLFPDKAHRANLDKLSLVMSAMKRAEQYANTSKTALSVGGAASVGAMFINPFLAVGTVGAQFGSGLLLASPRFARWLATTTERTTPQAANKALSAIAKAEPAIALNIARYSQEIGAAMNDNIAAPLAADEGQPYEQ